MQDKEVYESAIIRLVPKVEREEFLNIGAILYCRKKTFLKMQYHLDIDRICAFNPSIDIKLVDSYMKAWMEICEGEGKGGAIGALEQHVRFRWLTAPKSTIVQCSKVHPGRCIDAEKELNELFKRNVLLPKE